MFLCFLGNLAPCMIICEAAALSQFGGIDDRHLRMGSDGLIRLFAQIEPIKPAAEGEDTICSGPLSAPPEPFGGVAMSGDGIDPNADSLVGHVRLPMLKPPRFEPAIEKWRQVITEEWGRQQIPTPPGEGQEG